jgi:hypothetical protein
MVNVQSFPALYIGFVLTVAPGSSDLWSPSAPLLCGPISNVIAELLFVCNALQLWGAAPLVSC